MSTPDNFFVIFLVIILVMRIFLFIRPTPSPTIHGFRLHHYMYGVVLIPVAILAGSLPLYAIGVALFEDELTFILIHGRSQRDNYSPISLLGTAGFVVLSFFFRRYLVLPFN